MVNVKHIVIIAIVFIISIWFLYAFIGEDDAVMREDSTNSTYAMEMVEVDDRIEDLQLDDAEYNVSMAPIT